MVVVAQLKKKFSACWFKRLNDRCNSNSKKSIKDIAVACNCAAQVDQVLVHFSSYFTVQYIKMPSFVNHVRIMTVNKCCFCAFSV